MKVLFRKFVRLLFTLLYRVEIVHKERVPQKGAALLCANHNGILDMFFIGYKLERWIRWMAKEELFRSPLTKAFFTWLGAFPIKRGKGDVGSIKTAFRLLNEGEIVGIFPQGTRVSKEQRHKARIKPGAAMLAINGKVPVLPVAVEGKYKLFGRIRVVFGEPFLLEADPDRKYAGEELEQFSRIIMDRIFSLLEG